MRGLTGVLIGAGLLLLIVIGFTLRGGGDAEPSDSPARPGAGAPGGGLKGAGGANRPAGGMAGGAAGGGSRSSRVEDRLGELRAEYEKRQVDGNVAPAASKREVPTSAARTKDMVDRAKADLEDDESDEDPAELEELRTTLFNDPDPDERIGAVLMLTGDEGPESMRMLVEAMDDPDPEVRLAVVEALGDRSEEISAGTLVKALNDNDAEVRFEAVSILADIDTPEAQQLVQKAKSDPDPDVADLAAGADELNDDEGDSDDMDEAPRAPAPTARK